MSQSDSDSAFEFSASAISNWTGCHLRYGFRYILGWDGVDKPSAALGTKIHSELEQWLTSKKLPEIPAAKRLLPYLPLPTHRGLLPEHEFRILFPVGAARGYIDLVVPHPDRNKLPKGPWSKDRPIVYDHKSTARIDLAKTQEDLLTDPQALLYGTEARRLLAVERGVNVKEIPDVDLIWNYTSTKVNRAKPVHLKQTLPILEDGLGPLFDTVKEMRSAVGRGSDRVRDLPHDLRSCGAFGGCDYRDRCWAYQKAVVAGAFDGSGYGTATPLDWGTKQEEETSVDQKTLTRLRQISAKPVKQNLVDPVVQAETASPAPKAAAETKVTAEPSLPTPDTKGLDKPIPPGTSPVKPPDAAPDVSPNDPPEPATPVEVAKPKRGRPKKVAVPESVAPAVQVPLVDTEVIPVESVVAELVTDNRVADLTPVELDAALLKISEQAFRQGRLVLAQATLQALMVVRGGG